MSEEDETLWRPAKDPATGRTYYYHIETRETQWRKPIELASPEEREAAEAKDRQQREFFASMEANILNSIATGTFSTTPQMEKKGNDYPKEIEISIPSRGSVNGGENTLPLQAKGTRRAQMVRTISSMEDSVLVDLVQRVPSSRNLFRNIPSEDHQQQDIVFDPQAVDAAAAAPSRLPRLDAIANTLGRAQSLSLLEATRLSNRSLLMEAKATSRSSLNVIDEKAAMNEMGLEGLSGKDAGAEEDIESRDGLARELSFGTLIRSLPKEGESSTRSLYGMSKLDESNTSFKITLEEGEALEELAMVSEQMAKVGDESISDFKMEFDANGGMMYLQDITEDEDHEEEVEEENEGYRPSSKGDVSDADHRSNDQDMPPALVGFTAGTPGPITKEAKDTLDIPNVPDKSLHQQPSLRKLKAKPAMERRNTCGTLYVSSTMSSPDTEATIKCICGVYRAHILQSQMEDEVDEDNPIYRVFNDVESQPKPTTKKGFQPAVFVVRPPPPPLEEISAFFRDIFFTAKMETDCLIMSLIYIERLIKTTEGGLRPNTTNWRSLLFSCLILSSKVWDDMSMWNIDFSETCPSGVEFTLQRINELEIALLETLNYMVKVPASEYAKYYFVLRSMLIKSGLGGESLKASNPLDVQGARRLQQLSSMYQTKADSRRDLIRNESARSMSIASNDELSSTIKKLQLEHVVHM